MNHRRSTPLPGSTKSRASGRSPPSRSSPRSASTWRSSRRPGTSCRGRSSRPRTVQSGARSRSAKPGKGNPYLKRVLGDAAISAAKTDTFLGERYRRLAKRRGKLKALVGVARSILVIVWHLLSDPTASFRDLGPSTSTPPT